MCRREDGVEATAGASGFELEGGAVGHDAVHGEADAPEVVARGVEHHEVKSGAWLLGERVAPLVGRPEEGIVERVEVGTLRNGGPLRYRVPSAPTTSRSMREAG